MGFDATPGDASSLWASVKGGCGVSECHTICSVPGKRNSTRLDCPVTSPRGEVNVAFLVFNLWGSAQLRGFLMAEAVRCLQDRVSVAVNGWAWNLGSRGHAGHLMGRLQVEPGMRVGASAWGTCTGAVVDRGRAMR